MDVVEWLLRFFIIPLLTLYKVMRVFATSVAAMWLTACASNVAVVSQYGAYAGQAIEVVFERQGEIMSRTLTLGSRR